jgi:glutamyl/glutaminyl-tRNA synthetase
MHIGNLRSALYAYLFARKHGGTFLLRIEDTDQERYVDGAVDVIYNTLRDVGVTWEEGPDVGGEYGPYVQSERKHLYLPYAEQLIKSGHAYRCFCTKEELEQARLRDPLVLYEQRLLQQKVITPDDSDAMESEVRKTVDEAVKFADSSPHPEPEALYQDVLSEKYPLQK